MKDDRPGVWEGRSFAFLCVSSAIMQRGQILLLFLSILYVFHLFLCCCYCVYLIWYKMWAFWFLMFWCQRGWAEFRVQQCLLNACQGRLGAIHFSYTLSCDLIEWGWHNTISLWGRIASREEVFSNLRVAHGIMEGSRRTE